MHPLGIYKAGQYVARLSPPAIAQAARHARAAAPLETGGMLLGQVVDGMAHILAVTGPGRKAMHGLASFEADREHDNRLLRRVWPRLCYLGDWHTHPGGTAELSDTDVASARDALTPDRPAALHLLLSGDPNMAAVEATLFTVVSGEAPPQRMRAVTCGACMDPDCVAPGHCDDPGYFFGGDAA